MRLIKKSYNVVPGQKIRVATPEFLERIATVARKHGIPMLKITEAQRLAERCPQYYAANARKKERTARFMEHTSLEKFKETVRGK